MDMKEFERNLVSKLSKVDMDKTFLKDTTTAILNLSKKGYVFDRIRFIGTPIPDSILVAGQPADFFNLKDIARIRARFDIFPIGIIDDTKFGVNVTFLHPNR